jgi:lysophospholipase L1-like esterase
METSPRGAANKPRSSLPDAPPRSSLFEPALGALLAVAAAAVALTCAGTGAVARVAPKPAGSAEVGVQTRAERQVAKGTPAQGSAIAAAPTAPTEPPALGSPRRAPELSRFFAALDALARRERAESVRVLWFGDSHTAADYYTGAVRQALALHYGSGGPGFVRVGVGSYRHDLATLNRVGHFRIEPEPPARRSLQGDGVFGLGGMRVAPIAGPATMTLKVSPRALRGRVKFQLLFELPEAAAFRVSAGTQSLDVTDASRAERLAGSPILRLELSVEANCALTIEVRKGRPRFYGAVVEGSEPGLVLDTLGIDGARVATPLAWAEAPFIAEVAARKPELVVLAYGTNEAFDELNVAAYDKQVSDFLARLQRGAPAADCLIVGPPDALGTNGETAPRVASISDVYARVAARLGCAFVSAQSLMGGPGGFSSWLREDPPLARPDRIHLSPRGYRRLGELLAASVFGEPLPAPAGADKNSP